MQRSSHGHAGPGDRSDDKKKYTKFRKDNRCRFCREKAAGVDYKDIVTLIKMSTNQGKLYSRKRSGNCAKHQRATSDAVKRARYMALLPYAGQ
ncbi:MAG: 30S ribosomal protein S18 [Planctomycetes bacterium RBG_16_59_8]|nr:MAG: 30S ribosomal protein S18 [Planctomycetes bacterium RBG_16_59_8]